MFDYQPRGYQTTVTRNLYSLVLERCQGLIMESGGGKASSFHFSLAAMDTGPSETSNPASAMV